MIAERNLPIGNIGVSDDGCERHIVFFIHNSHQLVEPQFVFATEMGRRIREFLCTNGLSATEQVPLYDPLTKAIDEATRAHRP